MTAPPIRLHRGARLEDAVLGRVAAVLRRFGWRSQAVPYTGYGSAPAEGEGWARVLVRVRLAPPGTRPRPGWERAGGDISSPSGWPMSWYRCSWAADPRGQERSGRICRRGAAQRSDARLARGAGPAGRPDTVTEYLRVVGPDERSGLISDIDDTVMITALPRPLLAFWNTFVVKETQRRPVPGMAALYHRIRQEEPDGLVVYLSTGAWNVARAISRFLDRHDYPCGPLLMTDWGPTPDSWFRSGQAHKRRELRRLVRDFPQLQWVLVGDDGQHDPQLYEELADEVPEKLRMVLIRQLSVVEQVLTHGTPVPPESQALDAPSPVPWLRGPDGTSLAAQLK